MTSSSWRDEYIQALHDRDELQKASYQRVDAELIEAFTNLLDRTAALEAEKAASPSAADAKPRDPAAPASANDGTAQIRSDLAEALRSNGQLQSRIRAAEAELVNLRSKSKSDTKGIEDLSKERTILTRKVKDRDEELRGKTKLLGDVHDEVMSLNLQLNLSEQKAKKLKAENKELVDRWMASKGREAEEMNNTLQDHKDI